MGGKRIMAGEPEERRTTRRLMAAGMLGVAFGLCAALAPAGSQTLPKSLQEGGSEEALKQRQNQWTILLAGGTMDGYLRFADEIGKVLDDGDDMRVIPMITRGAASNLQDLLYLRGVDAALAQSDILEYFRTQGKVPNLVNRVHYIIRLPVAELHVTARADVRTPEDLRGKKVGFGSAGAAATLTGPIVFQRLGIEVEPVFIDRPTGLKMLMAGEIAALLGSLPKPVEFFTKIPSDSGLHLVPVPFTKALADLYVAGEFTSADYPNLVPPGQRIDTVAAPCVLAVYNWPKNSDRYRRLDRFVQYLFNRWDKLTQPPFHPRWRDVNLAATVPGWTRFAASDDMLRRQVQNVPQTVPDQPPSFQDFQTYLSQQVRAAPRDEVERDAMFRQFLLWRQQHGKP
jgi:TRAP-type uncharacterized transport system substrate-binding protein